jgi:hypothetical protein
MASGKKNYFRHNFNAHEDPKIVRLMNKHGLAGYAMFFILIEIYARQCENEFKESITINKRTLRQSWRKVGPTCDQGLADLQAMLLLRYTSDEQSYNIEIPNIVKYLGKYESKLPPNTPNKRKEKESKRKESKVNEESPALIDFVVEEWNTMAGKNYLSTIQKLTPSRKKAFKSVADIITSKEEWIRIINQIPRDGFRTGKNDRGWKADFDYMLREKVATKLLEESYAADALRSPWEQSEN